jgi:hypothetical protein
MIFYILILILMKHIYVAVQRNITDYQIYLYCILFKNIYHIYGNIITHFIWKYFKIFQFPLFKKFNNTIFHYFIQRNTFN